MRKPLIVSAPSRYPKLHSFPTMGECPQENVAVLLTSAGAGNPAASSALLDLLYDELRELARRRMANLEPGQTLEATALVHEAYLRLVGDGDPAWDSEGHFFAAAAHAMRNVIVDHARRRHTLKRGGDLHREQLRDDVVVAPKTTNEIWELDVVRLDEALQQLQGEDRMGPRRVDVVVMRYFVGMTHEQIARALGVDKRTVDRDWRYARAWILNALSDVTRRRDDLNV